MDKNNVLQINSVRFARLRRKLQAKDDSGLFGILKDLLHEIDVESVGDRELVESCRPYVRIHRWTPLSIKEHKQKFRIEVSCYSRPLSEWYVPMASKQETWLRLKRADGTRYSIPWDDIASGTHWYAELDCESEYWRLLEAEILSSPVDEFHRGSPLEERSARVESELKIKLDRERDCKIEIQYGEYQGRKGLFSRVSKDGEDILIHFCLMSAKSQVDALIAHDRRVRIPWKRVLAGEVFTFHGRLADYAIERIESGYIKRCLYANTSKLNRAAFQTQEGNPKVTKSPVERVNVHLAELFNLKWRLSLSRPTDGHTSP